VRTGERLREGQAQDLVAKRHLDAVRVDADQAPGALPRAAELRGIERHRVGMVVVHVRDGLSLEVVEVEQLGEIRQQILLPHAIGSAEAAVEAGGRDLQAPEGEIGKVHIELGLGMLQQIAPADVARLVALPLKPPRRR
jgi:hypothetical protein